MPFKDFSRHGTSVDSKGFCTAMSTAQQPSALDSSTSTAHFSDYESDGSLETSVSVTDLSDASSLTRYYSCERALGDLSTTTAQSFKDEDYCAGFPVTAVSSYEMLHTARGVHDPPSFYHLPELNKCEVICKPRLLNVPSQYAFDELIDYSVMDSPEQAYKLQSQADFERYAASSTSVQSTYNYANSKSVYVKQEFQ